MNVEKPVPSLATLRDAVAALARAYLYKSQPMICQVCRRPATGITVDIPKDRHCGDALCDKDTGNRKVQEDFRAPEIRELMNFLETYGEK